ncbi:MAG: hypothetical protein JW909_13865, partial [Planctomycetes bacterium]|nr:hypothetical protein [Planctomycetota bacterium]
RPRRPVTVHSDGIGIVRSRAHTDVFVPGSGTCEPKYSSADPRTILLDFSQRWRFYHHRPIIDVRTEIDWSACDRRVRLCFPTTMKTSRMLTEIPFGVIERDRYEMTETCWNNANGDWPAVSWGALEEKGSGFAVFNRGTPSYRNEDGALLVSVLRSPTFPNCLEEPGSYSAPVYDGMRDAGRHVFRHRLVFYEGGWKEACVVDAAREFNQPVPAALVPEGSPAPAWPIGPLPDGVVLAALKRPHDDGGLVLRLSEMHGEERSFDLEIRRGEFTRAEKTDFLEDPGTPLEMSGGAVRVDLRPFEIATLRLR